MEIEDQVFIARYVVGQLNTGDLVAFTHRKLCEGVYSDYFLDILDHKESIWELISPIFEDSIKDIGYTKPSFDDAIWFLVKYHVVIISHRKVNPMRQFRLLLKDIEYFDLHKGITKYVGDNIGIAYMYGCYHDDVSSESEISNGILSECDKWLVRYASTS